MAGKAVLAVIRASRPEFRLRMDKLAIAVHAAVMVDGYRLVATGASCSDEPPTAESPEVPIEGWNVENQGIYCFKYASEGTGPSILLKCLVVDSTLLATFLPLSPSGSPTTIELDLAKYTSGSEEGALVNMDELASTVSSALTTVTSKQQSTGAADSSVQTSKQPGSTRPVNQPAPDDDPLRAPEGSRRPAPWLEHDPLRVGGGDLDPLGLGSSSRPGLFPGGGYPDPLSGGGMHVGPDHPYFRDNIRNPLIKPGLSPPGLPPGARWDPIRPPGIEGFNPRDFQRQPGRGVHPDIGPPPGTGTNWDDMFG